MIIKRGKGKICAFALAAALVVFVGSLDVSFLKLHSPVTRLKSTGPDWTQSKMRLKMEFMTHCRATKHLFAPLMFPGVAIYAPFACGSSMGVV